MGPRKNIKTENNKVKNCKESVNTKKEFKNDFDGTNETIGNKLTSNNSSLININSQHRFNHIKYHKLGQNNPSFIQTQNDTEFKSFNECKISIKSKKYLNTHIIVNKNKNDLRDLSGSINNEKMNYPISKTEINEANSILKEICINDNYSPIKQFIIGGNKKQPTQSRRRINHSEEKLSGRQNVFNYNETLNNSKNRDFSIVFSIDNYKHSIENTKSPKTESTKIYFKKFDQNQRKRYSTILSGGNVDGRLQNIVDKDINNTSISEKTIFSQTSINENSNKFESVKSLIISNFFTNNMKQSVEKENTSSNINESLLNNIEFDKIFHISEQMDSDHKSVRYSLLDFISVSCDDLKHQTKSEIKNSIIHSKVLNDNSFSIKSAISNFKTIDDVIIQSMSFKKDAISNDFEDFKIKNSNISNSEKYEYTIKNNSMTSLICQNEDSLDADIKTNQINKLNIINKVNDFIDITNHKSFEMVFNQENQGFKKQSTNKFMNKKTDESKILDKFKQKCI